MNSHYYKLNFRKNCGAAQSTVLKTGANRQAKAESMQELEALTSLPIRDASVPAEPPSRRQTSIMRIVRDSEMSNRVKKLYDYTCQICGIRLETPAGPYAEGAHIKPLGIPHNGPDFESNILCVCPNDHVLLDDGAITLSDDLRILGIAGTLRQLTSRHGLDFECVRYHREHFGVLIAGVQPA